MIDGNVTMETRMIIGIIPALLTRILDQERFVAPLLYHAALRMLLEFFFDPSVEHEL